MTSYVQNHKLKACVSHVIFDMDGLLLATEDLYTQAANEIAEKFARKTPKLVTWDLKVRQMGLQKKDLARIMVKELDLTCTPQQYLHETEKLHQTLFPKVLFFPYIFISLSTKILNKWHIHRKKLSKKLFYLINHRYCWEQFSWQMK